MFKFWIYKLGQFLVNRLSPSASYRFATFLSDLQYVFSFRDRKAVRENLKCILPPETDVRLMTREVFRNFGRYLVEFFRMRKDITPEFIKEKVQIEGRQHLDQALQGGKGVILMSGHIGNWEWAAAIISLLGYPLMIIALPHKERPVNDLFNHQREDKGIAVVPSRFAVRRCIEYLNQKKIVAIAGDRDFSSHGEVVDFLGKKALIPKGAAVFSYKTGAPIVPTFLIRRENNSFLFHIGEPIYPPQRVYQGNVSQELLVQLMGVYIKRIEEIIYKYPTQWLMFRKFWIDENSEV